MTDLEAIEVLRFLIKHEMASDMFYGFDGGAIWIAENCNDLFYWACADLEMITPDKLPLLEACILECDAAHLDHKGEHTTGFGSIYAGILYACRVRGMRPQNPCYSSYPAWLWPLLDAAGPARPEKEAGSRERAEFESRRKKTQKVCNKCSGLGRVFEY